MIFTRSDRTLPGELRGVISEVLFCFDKSLSFIRVITDFFLLDLAVFLCIYVIKSRTYRHQRK